MNEKKQENRQETKLIRVKKNDEKMLEALAKKLASNNGHKPSNAEVIHYVLTHFEDNADIEGGITRIFDSIRSDLEFLFQRHGFSSNKANEIIAEIAFFQAIILQQVTGALPIKTTSEVLQHIPSTVRARIKSEKEMAEREAAKLRKATPEVIT